MQDNRNLYLFIVFCLFSSSVLQCKATCDSLLLSLSNAGICEDGVCRAKELAQTRTRLGQDHSFCFRVDQHEFNTPDKTINLTIVDSWVSYPLSNCYISDDPQILMQGYCHCPFAGSATCQDCPIPELANATNLCFQGINPGKGCIGQTGTGTHCVRSSFTGGNRYKVCAIGKPKVEVFYKFFDTIDYNYGIIDIEEGATISSSQANITFYDISNPTKLNDHMMVLDLLNPSYEWLVPREFINVFDIIDYQKMGWFRHGQAIHPKIETYMSTVNLKCTGDEFIYSYGLPMFETLLGGHPEWQLETVLPGGILSDPNADVLQANLPIYDPPLPNLYQGAYFQTQAGDIVPFGLIDSIAPSQSYYEQYGDLLIDGVLTNQGIIPSANGPLCNQWYLMGTEVIGGTQNVYYITQCGLPNTSTWGICRKLVEFNVGDWYPTNTYTDCLNPNFFATAWPTNFYSEWRLNFNSSLNTLVFYENSVVTKTQFNLTSDRLISDNVLEIASVDIEFLNITIQFDVTNVVPHINRVTNDDDYIYIFAESNTAKGTCLLMTSDDLCPTKSVEVSLAENKYKLPFLKSKFKGDVRITLQCYKNKDSVTFYLELDKAGADIDDNTIKPESVRQVSIDKSVLEASRSAFIKFFVSIGRFYGSLFILVDSTVGNFFLGLFLSALVTGAVPAGIYLIYLILLRTFTYLRYRWAMRYMRGKNGSTLIPTKNSPYEKQIML